MHFNHTNLYVFNDGSMCALEVVSKAQRLLNAWHEALRFTGGDLKLSKCYWRMQEYRWQNEKCTYSSSTVSMISISAENSSTEIRHIPSEKMRMLVGVLIVPYNESVATVLFYQNKINN